MIQPLTAALFHRVNSIVRLAVAIYSGQQSAPVLRPLPSTLLSGPSPVGSFLVEHWIKGPESYSENVKVSSEPGVDRVSVQKVEISYCVSVVAPARAA